MSVLANKLKFLRQQTGDNRNATITVAGDLSRIIAQLNEVVFPLFSALPSTGSGHDVESLAYGLSGNVLFTDVEASTGSGDVYYSAASSRPTTVKESFAAIQTQLLALKNEVDRLNEATEFDDTELVEALSILELKLGQVAEDVLGSGYPLNEEGTAVLEHSLAQALDAIGGLLTGYVSTGLTHEGSYPSLSIPTDSVTGLSTELDEMNQFIGRTSGDEPDYTDEGGPFYFSDKVSLREAIVTLDSRLFISVGAMYLEGSRLIPNPTDTGITRSVKTITASGEENYLSALDVSQLGGAHNISFNVSAPKDSRGRNPGSCKITLQVAAFSSPLSGNTVDFDLMGSTQVADGPRILESGNDLSYGFKSLDRLIISVPSTNKIYSTTSDAISLDSTKSGLLTFKLKRTYSSGSDNFEGTISILGVKIDWYYFG